MRGIRSTPCSAVAATCSQGQAKKAGRLSRDKGAIPTVGQACLDSISRVDSLHGRATVPFGEAVRATEGVRRV